MGNLVVVEKAKIMLVWFLFECLVLYLFSASLRFLEWVSVLVRS